MKWTKYLLLLALFVVRFDVYSITLDDQLAHCAPLQDEVSLTISHKHSVSQSMISNTYIIRSDGIYNNKTRFMDQGGAGMPDVLQEGESLTVGDEGFVFSREGYLTDNLKFFVNQGSEWLLSYGSKQLDLRDVLSTREVVINVEKQNAAMYIVRKIMVWMNEI